MEDESTGNGNDNNLKLLAPQNIEEIVSLLEEIQTICNTKKVSCNKTLVKEKYNSKAFYERGLAMFFLETINALKSGSSNLLGDEIIKDLREAEKHAPADRKDEYHNAIMFATILCEWVEP